MDNQLIALFTNTSVLFARMFLVLFSSAGLVLHYKLISVGGIVLVAILLFSLGYADIIKQYGMTNELERWGAVFGVLVAVGYLWNLELKGKFF